MTDQKASQNQPKEQPGKGRRVLLIVAVILLLGLNGVLIFVNNQQKDENTRLTEENTTLTAEKAGLLSDLDSMRSEVADLQSSGVIKDETIAELNANISDLERKLRASRANEAKPGEIKGYKNKIASLQSTIVSLNDQIAKMKEENTLLASEKAELDSLSKAQKLSLLELEEEKEKLANKVELGSILKARTVTMTGLRVKSGREKETDRAKQVNQLKICFSLFPNNMAEKGKKEVYFKIKGADGKTIGDGQSKFTNANGKQDDYTIMQEINFTGDTEEFCAYWDNKGNAFESGGYLVEIFIDGSKTGSYDLNLR